MKLKASKFNIFFIYNLKQVAYNSYSNEFIILDPLLYELFSAGILMNDFDELRYMHADFYNFLIEKGFLISEQIDEFEKVKQESILIDNDSSVFHLIVNPTMNCNFKCWYCYETHIKDSKMSETTTISIIKLSKNIINKQQGIKKFVLSFFGGEPLLYFNKVIKTILAELHNICKTNNIEFSSGMTTNGLLIDENLLMFCKSNCLNSLQITLDGNRQQHNKIRYISEGNGSYDRIVENIKLAAKYGIYVTVRINCSSNTMTDINDILNDFSGISEEERNYINFDLQKVWQEADKIENEMTDTRFYFREKGFSVSEQAGSSSQDSCYADKRYQATINYNGEVFKCTARDFTSNTGEGILNEDGQIIWNERYEKRLNSKFNNNPCRECRILPICRGGCSQHAIENEGVDYCVHNYDEEAKTQIVVNKLKTLLQA